MTFFQLPLESHLQLSKAGPSKGLNSKRVLQFAKSSKSFYHQHCCSKIHSFLRVCKYFFKDADLKKMHPQSDKYFFTRFTQINCSCQNFSVLERSQYCTHILFYVRLDQYELFLYVYLVKNFIPEWLILDSFFKVCILISIQTKGLSIVYYEQRSAISLVFYERYYIEAQQHTILSIAGIGYDFHIN